MGVYLCIANNGIPPLVSKRTLVSVHFPPSVQVTNGLVGTPLGSEISITCRIEASPRPVYYWATGDGGILLTGARYRVREDRQPPYSYRVTLEISGVNNDDFRPYACVAKNAVGEAEDTVQLHRIEVPARPPPRASADAQSRSEAHCRL
ncbi:lachesin-like [Pollicipes pollicipes]|uniref:lachesin-like n=1 Tax=Pollicipes pollicipes TaxID=41117 RepID=UPI00188589A9|nr:lachesin-like [Pollicipes pollicipes]